jgi:hypothetical protein
LDDTREAVVARTRGKATSIRDGVVDGYVTRLRKAGLQRGDFEAVVADLTGDKSARKSEVISIASKYVGVSLGSRSRKDALEVIRKRFVELVRFERKQEIASKVTPS